mmetsp:Transcript_3081/g.5306  ORF Transcript_3081/g.5306 Transcript_3081/m.5306 type:complete len:202 (+) Transcript_3081:1791-2396(+)
MAMHAPFAASKTTSQPRISASLAKKRWRLMRLRSARTGGSTSDWQRCATRMCMLCAPTCALLMAAARQMAACVAVRYCAASRTRSMTSSQRIAARRSSTTKRWRCLTTRTTSSWQRRAAQMWSSCARTLKLVRAVFTSACVTTGRSSVSSAARRSCCWRRRRPLPLSCPEGCCVHARLSASCSVTRWPLGQHVSSAAWLKT